MFVHIFRSRKLCECKRKSSTFTGVGNENYELEPISVTLTGNFAGFLSHIFFFFDLKKETYFFVIYEWFNRRSTNECNKKKKLIKVGIELYFFFRTVQQDLCEIELTRVFVAYSV